MPDAPHPLPPPSRARYRARRAEPPEAVAELLDVHCLRAGGTWDYLVLASDEAVTIWHARGHSYQRSWPRRTIQLGSLAEWLSQLRKVRR